MAGVDINFGEVVRKGVSSIIIIYPHDPGLIYEVAINISEEIS
jgi:hypothetical protein